MSRGQEIIKGLQELLVALKKGDISQFRRTKLIKNKDGTIKRVVVDGKDRKDG
jgi:hypothetical protein